MHAKYLIPLVLAGGFVAMPFQHRTVAAQNEQTVEITARRFTFSPSEITLKRGQSVTLVLVSTDVSHGLRVRDLNLELRADKKKPGQKTFTPEKTGDFVGHCSVFCGLGHGSMTLTVHVIE